MTRRRHIVRGRLTRVDLAAVDGVFAPPEKNAWGRKLPPFDPVLARFCAELSAATYDLEVERFFDAGWMDCTFQAENRLFDAIDGRYGEWQPAQAIQRGIRMKKARGAMRFSLGDVLRGVRQLVATDTGKVLTMAHPLQDGRFVIALSFMGTSRKFYDWVTNLKMSCKNGLHEGFSQVARQLMENADRIAYPRVAKALGREKLTLSEAVNLAAREDSPVRILVCGHSQGGASAQAYVHLLMEEQGALCENLLGYTFAAPTVASLGFEGAPEAYPLYNIVNAEDFVPRMGAYMRMGVDMVYMPDEAFRSAYYGYVQGEPAAYARERGRRLMRGMTDTPTIMEGVTALCRAMQNMPDQSMAQRTLGALNAGLKYLTPAMSSLGLTATDIIRLFERQMMISYRAVTNQNPDEARLTTLEGQIMDLIGEIGPERFTQAFGEVTLCPHGITQGEGKLMPPYIAIVQRFSDSLRPCVWREEAGRALQVPAPGAWFSLTTGSAAQTPALPSAGEAAGEAAICPADGVNLDGPDGNKAALSRV